MREFEFRAKTKNSGRWAYGDLIKNRYKSRQGVHIYEKNESFGYQFVRINKKTIGQYTGLKDKNGTKIFEGDILIGDIPELLGSQNLIGIVEYQESAFIVKIPNRKSWQIQKVGFCSFVNYRVIGNIYDNPELLGGQNG